MTSLRLFVVGLVAVPLLFALPADAVAATHAITIANFAFAPASATITAGDTVTWTNTDPAPHDVTVTSGPVAIHSPTMSTGQSWTYTFTAPGTYAYICSIHPNMHATLVVVPVPKPVVVPAAPVRVATPPARTSVAVAAPTAVTPMPMPSTSSVPPVASVAAPPGGSQTGLDPLLLVAGLVAGVATLCLLLIGSKPESS